MPDLTTEIHSHAALPERLIDRVPTHESQIWMKVHDIQGEGFMATREGEIEVHGVEWGFDAPAPAAAGQGRRRSAAVASDVIVTLATDASVPHLVSAMVRRKSVAEVRISWLGIVDGQPVERFKYRLDNVIISSVRLAASKSMPAVQLALSYESMELRYVELASDGSTGPSHEVEFDVKTPR